mmetsp:Transcript_21621/g.29767  ORF Transcript_21621/g.29767 Transcript_21621/m.29767 type:complete len:209 (+) Transcript_21621:1542-2168(+)
MESRNTLSKAMLTADSKPVRTAVTAAAGLALRGMCTLKKMKTPTCRMSPSANSTPSSALCCSSRRSSGLPFSVSSAGWSVCVCAGAPCRAKCQAAGTRRTWSKRCTNTPSSLRSPSTAAKGLRPSGQCSVSELTASSAALAAALLRSAVCWACFWRSLDRWMRAAMALDADSLLMALLLLSRSEEAVAGSSTTGAGRTPQPVSCCSCA